MEQGIFDSRANILFRPLFFDDQQPGNVNTGYTAALVHI